MRIMSKGNPLQALVVVLAVSFYGAAFADSGDAATSSESGDKLAVANIFSCTQPDLIVL